MKGFLSQGNNLWIEPFLDDYFFFLNSNLLNIDFSNLKSYEPEFVKSNVSSFGGIKLQPKTCLWSFPLKYSINLWRISPVLYVELFLKIERNTIKNQ